MPEFHRLFKTDELAPGQAKCIELSERRIALFNVNGSFYAIDDSCTHRNGPLSTGAIEDNSVTCQWHGAKFDLITGQPLTAPAHAPVSTYNVRLAEGHIEIEI